MKHSRKRPYICQSHIGGGISSADEDTMNACGSYSLTLGCLQSVFHH